ncbi:MAG: bifunctional phosphoribosylaminoimidazolecarboxamide formyltransferase/IMP cyclohydrolase [Leptospiraceae bacterium]|nr:bifunctional phosphoribosylaminoimidazolecarboxamide formyltransferase/IMP cyclohydrolase [Leptospiraceae bacterium]MCP5513222.1 bifunctional phosphoribosylaminoimidazolecarboxamide formyltransferase/IMP cyclohydrolase [Leptospiraceae bacterium]
MIKINRALISVSDKTNLIPFAKFLSAKGVEIISTGGTLKELIKNDIPAIKVEDYTGFPEMLDGRLKTLHPIIHGGLLGNPGMPGHSADLEKHNIQSIDLVVVNLYPFAETIAKPNVALEEAIENIDIGGPTMLRSGAKNYQCTVVVTDIDDYPKIQDEMEKNSGSVLKSTSFLLAQKVFAHTALYDSTINQFFNQLENNPFPEILTLGFKKKQSLRYGENPHQSAAFYESITTKSQFNPLQGKELSFNNMLDFDAAFHTAALMKPNSVSIIKHLNPCGVASAATTVESFELARRTDPVSAFGGVIGVSGVVDSDLAEKIVENFVEGVIAEKFTEESRVVFSRKPNIRLIEISDFRKALSDRDFRPIHQGLLLQDRDYEIITENDLKIVSKKKPTDEDIKGLMFAWSCVRLIKSNAIVYTDKNSTLGIGAGQMSRVDSVEIGAAKARKSNLDLKGSYVGSDAFFPFRDGIDALAKEGARAIIQPGGSIRDEEVIRAADEHDLIMVFTGMRHFRH